MHYIVLWCVLVYVYIHVHVHVCTYFGPFQDNMVYLYVEFLSEHFKSEKEPVNTNLHCMYVCMCVCRYCYIHIMISAFSTDSNSTLRTCGAASISLDN